MEKMMSKRAARIVFLLCCVLVAPAQIIVLDQSSNTFAAAFGGWDYFPNTGYRYAEGSLNIGFTRALAHPTWLNVIHQYSQSQGSCQTRVYIATTRQCSINPNTDPHFHIGWWNAASATTGYYVGEFTSTWTKGLASFNVEEWLQAHPADLYYVLFDQQDNFADVCIDMNWLGPEGRTTMLQEPAELHTPVTTAASRPNPSRGRSEINYTVSHPGDVTVRILDAAGRPVRMLLSGVQGAGAQTVFWDGTTDQGEPVPAGTYFFEVHTPESRAAGKIIRN